MVEEKRLRELGKIGYLDYAAIVSKETVEEEIQKLTSKTNLLIQQKCSSNYSLIQSVFLAEKL